MYFTVKNKNSNEENKKDTPTFVSEIENESLHLLKAVERTEREISEIYPQMLENNESDNFQGNADSLKRATVNITKALTKIYMVSDEFNARLKDIRKQKKRKKLHISVPANAEIDLSEERCEHFFAKGINFYKILLIFFAGSFAGVVVELLWCLFKNGYLESRSGLVYGPFNPLYGAGAVLMTVFLYRFRNRGAWISMLGGMLVGGAVEYLCSWGQELAFGSRSWDYSNMPFNINGRICLLYTFFWGFLGVLWIKRIYPLMAKFILKLPNRAGKIVTWVALIFFIFNGLVSAVAMYRWTQRIDSLPAKSPFWEFVDERFPDERMERIYANMEFTEKR